MSLTHLEVRPGRGAGEAGLGRMVELLRRLGDPHRGRQIVHVAGTSGKGTLVHLLQRALAHHGHRVMAFTSPHLTTPLERFSLGEGLLPLPTFERAFTQVWGQVGQMYTQGAAPSFFETCLGIFLVAARELGADPLVIEAGIGGRLDTTNVLGAPLLAVVTDVGLDHEELLGQGVEAIAREKAGIFKAGGWAASGARREEARRVLAHEAAREGCRLWQLGQDAEPRWEGDTLQLEGGLGGALTFPTVGEHDRHNAALLALCAALLGERGVALTAEDLHHAWERPRPAGRWEPIGGAPPLLLDIAHNPDKMAALAGAYRARWGRGVLVMTLAQSKALDPVLEEAARAFDRLIVTRPLRPAQPMWPLREIARRAQGLFPHVEMQLSPDEALMRAAELWGGPGPVVVSGSTSLVGEVRARYQSEEEILAEGQLRHFFAGGSITVKR